MTTSLIERLQHWSRLAPDRPAHESAGRQLTYRELDERSTNLAARLLRVLPPDQSPIAVIGHKEPEMLIGFAGCTRAGHPYIPIDTSTPATRLERILATAGRPLVLTPETIAEMSAERQLPTIIESRQPNDPYYVIFTSGSTGEPKGVVITHDCLATFVNWLLAEHIWEPMRERVLNQAPFSFDLSVMDLSVALATGGTLVSVTAEQIANPKLLYQALARSDLTAWVSTPSFAQMCLAERTFDAAMLPGLRRFLFCGETLPPEVANELLLRFPDAEVWNTYGPTEATVATTSIRITREVLQQYSPLPVGKAMPATQVLTLNETGDVSGDGDRGEIVVAGPNVSTGYLGRPDLTQRAFFQHNGQRAYRTGDWGRYRDGLLFFEGRQDSQIKLHGYRIEIGDIEENLRSLDQVRDAVVIPVTREGRLESLAAFVVPASTLSENEFRAGRALRQELGTRLPPYMVPRTIRFLDSLPMTANGKADRRKLQDLVQ